MATIEEQLTGLATMSPAQLRDLWVVTVGLVVPRISPNMLRLALAYELQAKSVRRIVTRHPAKARPASTRKDTQYTRTKRHAPGAGVERPHPCRCHR